LSRATITILDVGHGSGAVIQTPEVVCLIDTGSGGTILEYTRVLALQVIDDVLISHVDRDHVGGLIGLLSAKTVQIRNIWLNSDAFKGSQMWRDIAYELDTWARAAGKINLGVTEGDAFDVGPLRVEIVAPRTRLAVIGPGGRDQQGRRLETNSLSVVARLKLGAKPVMLFPGDLDILGLDHLLDQQTPPDLRAPILAFPHHGGHVSRAGSETANYLFAMRLIELVKPQTVLFSIGRRMHGTPRPEVVRAVRDVVPDVRIACTQLSGRCAASDPSIPTYTHLTPAVARGRAARWCCGGSIVVEVSENQVTVLPDRAAHNTFIQLHAPTSLCN